MSRQHSKLAAVLALLFALAALAVAGPALASDSPTVVYPAEERVSATPGETVDIDVAVSSQGGAGGVGLQSIALVVDYDETNLTAVGVEPGTWLEQGEETNVETDVDIDDENGQVVVEQWRDPPAGGATGYDLFATLEMKVDENAPVTNATVSFDDTDVQMTDEYPMPIFAHDATVEIQEPTSGGVFGIPENVAVVAAGILLVALVSVAAWKRK